MKIIYLGAEVPSNRTLLETTDATHVGVSFWRLKKRGLPKKGYLLTNYFKDDLFIYVYPGIPRTETLSTAELNEFMADYEDFIANNLPRINLFSEVCGSNVDLSTIEQQRKTAWSQVPEGKFLPVWDERTGLKGIKPLTEQYLNVGIPGEVIDTETQLAVVTRTFARSGTRFHILGSARPDNLRSVAAEMTTTMSWLSPMINGETIVWDGSTLHRYPKRMKDQARLRYKNVYLKAGLDPELILNDDSKEVCRLAVWSYNQYEMRLNNMSNEFIYDINDEDDGDESAELTPSVSNTKGVQPRKLEPRNPAEMGNLPVFGFTTKTEVDEDGLIQDVTTVRSTPTSLRACDTCFVAAQCPAFKPQSMCAFNLPIEVKTKDQLKDLINAIIEMQAQRVAFMRFAEEMNGGYADPNVSQEMDRLFKLIKTVKELDDSREFIRMTVERQGSAGVLSSIFGDKAQALKELPDGGLNESQTTKIIKQSLEDN